MAKQCPQGHEITGYNAMPFINIMGYLSHRCRVCHNESTKRSRDAAKERGKSKDSGQIGRPYIPEFKPLRRDPFEHMHRCEESRWK